jgi:hypothetical protein
MHRESFLVIKREDAWRKCTRGGDIVIHRFCVKESWSGLQRIYFLQPRS